MQMLLLWEDDQEVGKRGGTTESSTHHTLSILPQPMIEAEMKIPDDSDDANGADENKWENTEKYP